MHLGCTIRSDPPSSAALLRVRVSAFNTSTWRAWLALQPIPCTDNGPGRARQTGPGAAPGHFAPTYPFVKKGVGQRSCTHRPSGERGTTYPPQSPWRSPKCSTKNPALLPSSNKCSQTPPPRRTSGSKQNPQRGMETAIPHCTSRRIRSNV